MRRMYFCRRSMALLWRGGGAEKIVFLKFTRECSMAKEIFKNDWQELLADEMAQPYYRELRTFLIEEYRTKRIYPDMYSIFNALHYTSFADTKVVPPAHGCLIPWARQGVLLLNTVLTVRAHAAASHAGHGWERFTDHIIQLLGARERPLAFILWGSPARKKHSLITNPRHLIVESPHPSPLSAHRGFFGSRPFSRANDFLVQAGETPIEWQLPPASEIEA